VIEVIAEHYYGARSEKLEELDAIARSYDVLPHGLGLSLGTDAPLDGGLVRASAQLAERVNARWFTEHLAFTGVPGLSLGHLASLPFTWEAVEVVARNTRQWREVVGVPVLLENIAYIVSLPGEMTEAQFIGEVLDRADCGLLLDLHNLYANARNHAYDAVKFLESLPLERVLQVHVAGGRDEAGLRLDSHDAPVPEEVWDLLVWLAPRAPLQAVIVEWDTDLPDFAVMQAQMDRALRVVEVECVGAA